MLLVLDPLLLHIYCAVFLEGSPDRLNLIFNDLFFARSDKYISIKDTAPDGTAQAMWEEKVSGSKRVVQSSEFV